MKRSKGKTTSGGVGASLRRLVGGKAVKQALIAEYKSKLKEIAIHKMVAKHLNDWRYPDVYWWHTPNGEKRDIATAVKLQQMGVRPGISDIIAIHNRRIYALELKRSGEKATIEQLEFGALVITIGGAFSVVDSFDAAVAQLEQWGLLRIRTTGR